MKRTHVISAVLGVLVLASAAYLVLRTRPKSPEQVEIGTFSKALSYAPLYVAKHFGWFQEHPTFHGAEIVYKEFNDRPAISAALTAHEITLLFSAEIPAIMCEAQGNDLQIWGLSSTATQKVLVRSGLGISQPGQLRGRRIAVLQGTSSHYGLLSILRIAQLSEADISISYMPPGEARSAFETGQIDAWAVWAPFVEEQEVRGTGVEIGGEGAWIHSVLSVPAYVFTDHPEVARAAQEIIYRAKDWIVAHPADAEDIVAREMGLKLEVVQRAWPKFTWSTGITEAIVQDTQQKADFLAELNKTRGDIRVDVRKDLFAPGVIQKSR